MPPENESPLESLERRVYQKQSATPEKDVSVPAYSNLDQHEAYGWQAPAPVVPKKRMPWTVKFLVSAGAFLALAALAAAFLIFHGTRAVSSDRVKIEVPPIIGVASGTTVPIVVTIRNENPTALVNASLYATLPPGTRTGDGTDAPLTQYSDVLGTLAPGATVTRTIQVQLFGTEGQTLTIPMKVEYRTEGSNAQYVTNFDYAITVSTSPLSVQVRTLSQSPSGQPITLAVTVRSNASTPVTNVALSAQYPSGFSVKSSDPNPAGANFYTLGTLAPGEQKVVKVTGVLIGQNADQRVFHFTAGSANTDGTNTLGNRYAEGSSAVAITNPFLNVALSLNSEAADTVLVKPGQPVGAQLTWTNTLPDILANASIRVQLSGNALSPNSISQGTGYYRSSDSSIIFASDTNPALASLTSGSGGAGSFSFAVLPESALGGVKNPSVTLNVSITGTQGAQGSASQVLTSTLTRTVKVSTALTASNVLTHSASGAGPVPPVVGTETSYMVTLSARTSVNSVGAAKETFLLPSYVQFDGGADAGVAYNPDTRTVTWTIGDIQPGTVSSAHFGVRFTPSSSQQGFAPTLLGEQMLTGTDRFTGAQIQTVAEPLTTQLPGSTGSGTVK